MHGATKFKRPHYLRDHSGSFFFFVQRNRFVSDTPDPLGVCAIPIKMVPVHHQLLGAPCNWLVGFGLGIPSVAIRIGEQLRPLVRGGRRGPPASFVPALALVLCSPLWPDPITRPVDPISIPQQGLPIIVVGIPGCRRIFCLPDVVGDVELHLVEPLGSSFTILRPVSEPSVSHVRDLCQVVGRLLAADRTDSNLPHDPQF